MVLVSSIKKTSTITTMMILAAGRPQRASSGQPIRAESNPPPRSCWPAAPSAERVSKKEPALRSSREKISASAQPKQSSNPPCQSFALAGRPAAIRQAR